MISLRVRLPKVLLCVLAIVLLLAIGLKGLMRYWTAPVVAAQAEAYREFALRDAAIPAALSGNARVVRGISRGDMPDVVARKLDAMTSSGSMVDSKTGERCRLYGWHRKQPGTSGLFIDEQYCVYFDALDRARRVEKELYTDKHGRNKWIVELE